MHPTTEKMNRTVCACEQCVACCKRQPGPLIPGDFERIADYLGETREQAKAHFKASPGALVGIRGGTMMARIPSITPERKADGSCVFLQADGRCGIHPVAPFGCAYFDMHMDQTEGNRRSMYAIRQQCDPEYQKLREELKESA